ncbi:MAG TPA: carboxypeptidase-like regulatory domain-containing protein [Candidatus Limnocylindria bacterium]
MQASPSADASPSAQTASLEGIAVAGPTCPVVTDPPQSGCEDQPVEGARLVIVDRTGDEVATVVTGADGRFQVDLAPGTYEVQPQPVEGLMHTAVPVTVHVASGEPAEVTISYDTGIR